MGRIRSSGPTFRIDPAAADPVELPSDMGSRARDGEAQIEPARRSLASLALRQHFPEGRLLRPAITSCTASLSLGPSTLVHGIFVEASTTRTDLRQDSRPD
jgi:hypothetical protein